MGLWGCLEMKVPMGAPRSLFLIENWKHRGTMGHPYFETSPQRNGNTTSALNLPVPPQHSSPPLFPEPGALSVQRTLGHHFLHFPSKCLALPQNLSLFRPSFSFAARFRKEHMTCNSLQDPIWIHWAVIPAICWIPLMFLLHMKTISILIRNIRNYIQGAWNDSAWPSPTPALSGYQYDKRNVLRIGLPNCSELFRWHGATKGSKVSIAPTTASLHPL